MLVIPVAGDKIRTKDDGSPRVVSSYTSLKDEPALYLQASAAGDRYVYFSDIVEINGVKVEYESDSKVFNALGPLRRKFNIPQPKDKIVVKLIEASFDSDPEEVEVTSLRLHSKKHGEAKGLLVMGEAQSAFTLIDILDIKRRDWTESFDHDKFVKYYFDYCPIGFKSKG